MKANSFFRGWTIFVIVALVMAGLFAVQTDAQQPQGQYLRVINNGTTVLSFGMAVQLDTASLELYADTSVGVWGAGDLTDGNTFTIPGTTSVRLDSQVTAVGNTQVGAGYLLRLRSQGSNGAGSGIDSVYITGTFALEPWITAESGTDTTILIEVTVGSDSSTWCPEVVLSIDTMRCVTTLIDSFALMYHPFLGVAEADSNETDLLGYIAAVEDSISSGDRGRIRVLKGQGIGAMLVNGDVTACYPATPLSYGSSGLVPSEFTAYDAGDTTKLALDVLPKEINTYIAQGLMYVGSTLKKAAVLFIRP